jgi:hypothetical protein
MKAFGKIVICIIVILAAIGIAYLIYIGREKETNSNDLSNTNPSTNVQNDDVVKNETSNDINENTDYIGKEENKEESKEDEKIEKEPEREEQQSELTGEDKAIDIVKKQYALDGQTVRFDHMEGNDYIIKINEGTAVTWYLVNGTTWEAEEY